MIEKEWYASLGKDGRMIAELLAGNAAQTVLAFKILKDKFDKDIYFEVSKEQYIEMLKNAIDEV